MREETKKRIGEIIEEAIAAGVTAGVSVLFIENGEEVHFDVHGMADKENGIPLRRDHIHRIFSMTKPITATAAMILMERGVLDFGTPVHEILPGFEGNTLIAADGSRVPSPTEMTVLHLLNMTSGLSYGGLDSEAEKATVRLLIDCSRKMRTPEEVGTVPFAIKLGQLPLCFEPDSNWQYSLSADVLGAVIETVSGKRFGDFLRDEIFAPLHMEDTGFFVPEEKQDRLAECYHSTNTTEMRHFTSDNLMIRYDMKGRPAFESGGAGLCSTIDDYARFAHMLLNRGELDGVRILKPATVDYFTSGDLTPAQQAGLRRRFGLGGFTYQHLMRQMREPGSYAGPTREREYGWDSWTGCYFACMPMDNALMVLMEQKAECGTIPMTRKIRNVWLTDSYS